MGFSQAIILGIVQGITEFLPISSKGHLIVFQHFMDLTGNNLPFDIAIHLGTLLSVLLVYRKVVGQVIFESLLYIKTRQATPAVRLFALTFVGSIPVAIVGFLMKSQVEMMFADFRYTLYGFYLTGFVLFFTKNKIAGQMGGNFFEKIERSDAISLKQALIVGCAQACAILPGVSRAGTTIAAGLYAGLDRATAALFSFMLAMPAILGAGLLEARHLAGLSPDEMKVFGVGAVTSFIMGLVGLKLVVLVVKEGRLHFFAFYLWTIASVLLLKSLMG